MRQKQARQPHSQGWLESRLALLQSRPGPAILLDEGGWGSQRLLEALEGDGGKLLWLRLSPYDEGDPIAVGNKLADAVTAALGRPLFGYGMPYGYGLAILESFQQWLGPLIFAVSHAEYAPKFAQGCFELRREETHLTLHFGVPRAEIALPKAARVIGPDQLKLSFDEACLLAGEKFSKTLVAQTLEACGGKVEDFLTRVVGEAPTRSIPVPLSPPETPVGAAQAETLIPLLLNDNRPFEALELAVRHTPRSVSSLLQRAGKSLWARGNPGRLYTLLSQLSEALRDDETLQLWRLASALELGKEAEVLAEVERFLRDHKAPEVRALYASAKLRLGDPEACLREAQCAACAEATPLTLLHYGFALGTSDPERGLGHLREALRLAERHGEEYWASLTAASLAGRLTALGHYQEAADYGAWGHKLEQGGHAGTRLFLLNEWAFARILRGDVINLEETLRRELGHLEKAYHNLALLFRGTLADLLLATGQAEEAMQIYEGLWNANRRREALGGIANCYVRGLLELGAYEQALRVAEQALCLTEDLPLIYRRRALLAYGLALSVTRPGEARGVLEEAAQQFADPLLAPRLAQARLYLIWVQLRQGRQEEAGQVLAEPGVCWDEFGEGGLRYLLGPEHAFQEVMAMLQGEVAPLELHFLQKPQVRYQGQVLPLGRRLAELLAVLALHLEGLNLEQLALAVYGETPNVSACKTGLSRLRELVPLEAHPYRLGVSVKADFLELPKLLKAGRMREAMALYQRPLLACSQSPVISEERDFLEEALRQAAMKAADPEALLTLAKGLKDDLAIWEAALHALSEDDPRRLLVVARVKELQKTW